MEDTIAAIGTAPGEGGIGIIRISGEHSLKILKEIFRPSYESGSEFENRKLNFGHIVNKEEEEMIDEVLVVYMRAPNTYTCEDIVEINCHGSMISLKKTLSLVLSKGARMADKGEFTKRAFLNGRLDLSQAEAVMDMIKAKTDKGYESALGQLDGKLQKKIKEIRAQIMEVLVQLVVNIDYPDEDIEEISYEQMKTQLLKAKKEVEMLIASKDTGKIIKEGLNTVIIGKPNVGKSSLMNQLLRESRSIVTDIPGTTRDTVEELMSLKGAFLKITDTAGIRETQDFVEKIGVERSKESFDKADLVIFIVDGSQKLEEEDAQIIDKMKEKKAIVLLNKTDLGNEITKEELEAVLPGKKIIESSMVEEKGIKELEDEIEDMIFSGIAKQENSLLITNIRHEKLLESTQKQLEDAVFCINQREALEIIEIDVKSSWESLGEIIGETVNDEIIDQVFAQFCLGK